MNNLFASFTAKRIIGIIFLLIIQLIILDDNSSSEVRREKKSEINNNNPDISQAFTGNNFDSVYRKKPNSPNENDYYPLTVGNKWQYIKSYIYTNYPGGSTSHYSLVNKVVLGDTAILGKTFYKTITNGIIEIIRYSNDNKLYMWQDTTEILIMDFDLNVGENFYSGGYLSRVIEGFIELWGISRYWKGYRYLVMSDIQHRFVDSIGYVNYLYYQNVGYTSVSTNLKVINALIRFDDSLLYHSDFYQPEIQFTPISVTDTLVVSFEFNVNHQHSKFSTTGTSRNFIDNVWIEYFYAKQDSSTIKDSIFANVSENSTLCNASILLDSLKFSEGFKFYYAIHAKDKALIPQFARSPETDYYELSYDPNPVSVGQEKEMVYSFFLSQNYPNPFNPSTKIKYSIPSVILRQAQSDILVTLKVYDVLGNEIATLINEAKTAGEYEIQFDGTGFPSGIYFYQLRATPSGGQAGSYVETKKMVLLR